MGSRRINEKNPLVSIGFPVYNGEAFLEEAIESILTQTYSNLEIIISDNASTDRTETICRYYHNNDTRIRYFRNNTNLGASINYNAVFRMASGKYFKWSAHDDVCDKRFIHSCIQVLEQNTHATLSYTKTKYIDQSGNDLDIQDRSLNFTSPLPHMRFYEQVIKKHWCYHVFGLFRTNVLNQTSLIGNYPGSDRVLLADLSLRGPFIEVPETLLLQRQHKLQSTKVYTRKKRYQWFDPNRNAKLVFPEWRLLAEYFKVINRADIWHAERIGCYHVLFQYVRNHRKRLIKDLLNLPA